MTFQQIAQDGRGIKPPRRLAQVLRIIVKSKTPTELVGQFIYGHFRPSRRFCPGPEILRSGQSF